MTAADNGLAWHVACHRINNKEDHLLNYHPFDLICKDNKQAGFMANSCLHFNSKRTHTVAKEHLRGPSLTLGSFCILCTK